MQKDILFFSNTIAPYNIPYFNGLADSRHGKLLFFFDMASEQNRSWQIDADQIRFDYIICDSLRIEKASQGINQTKVFRNLYFPFYIFREVRKRQPKIIISIEYGLRTIFSLLAAKFHRSQLVIVSDVTSQTESGIALWKKVLRKWMTRQAAGFIARSRHAADYIYSLGAKSEKVAVAPYATLPLSQAANSSTRFVHGKPETSPKFLLLYCGQIIHRKGIDLLVKAVEALPDNYRCQLKVIVAGGTEAQLEVCAPGFNRELFQALGFCSPEDLNNLYRQSDCMVLPSRHDTWALVVNEAMAAGCPVLVSKYAGAAEELVIHEQTGLVFDPLNAADFQEKLIFAMSHPDALRQYRIQAYKLLEQFSFARAVENTGQLLVDLTYAK